MSFLLSPIFSLQQNPRKRGQNSFCPEVVVEGAWGRRRGEVT
jgi:hypothetical protein